MQHLCYSTHILTFQDPYFTTFFRSHFYVSANSTAPTIAGHAADCKSTVLSAHEVTTIILAVYLREVCANVVQRLLCLPLSVTAVGPLTFIPP